MGIRTLDNSILQTSLFSPEKLAEDRMRRLKTLKMPHSFSSHNSSPTVYDGPPLPKWARVFSA